MSEKKTIRMFESIPKFETYSHYNSTLEKFFKNNSLKNLITTLKRQKPINEISLIDEIAKKDTNEPIDVYAEEDANLKKINNYDEYDIFDKMYDHHMHLGSKNIDKKQKDMWKTSSTDLKTKIVKPELDPFKYNPNYTSIYKNVPSVKIIDPKKNFAKFNIKNKGRNKKSSYEKDKKPFVTDTNIYKNKKNNFLSPKLGKTQSSIKKIESKTLDASNNSNNSSNKKDIKLPQLTKLSKNRIIDSINIENDNHAIRFSKYIPRKFIIPYHNENVSYLNPFNYIKPKNKTKSIDFDKMLQRNEKNFIHVYSLKNPSFGQYNPRYNLVERNHEARMFNPEDKDFKNDKKYLMKKLWSSYKVITQYQLVDNNKIIKNSEKIFN